MTVEAAVKALRWVWGVHFRIPESAYWGALVATIGATSTVRPNTTWALTGAVVGVLAVAGVVRWQLDRRRCRESLVVARFYEGGDTEGHGEETQRIVVDSLRTQLPPRLGSAVQPVSVVVGFDERKFATHLARRLRAGLLLYGRIAAPPDGGWTVLPRILQPISGDVLHRDYLTMDATPARASFGPLVSPLPRQQRVLDEEYPFEFCQDLEGVIRGTAGQLAVRLGEFSRAETLLRDALNRAPMSTIPQFDALRVDLAWSLDGQGRQGEALQLLRERASGVLPSAHLLREFSTLLRAGYTPWNRDPDPRLRAEAINALRLAANNEQDPARDITIYNLQSMLSGGDATPETLREGSALLDELLASDTGYRKLWWVKNAKARYLWDEAGVAYNAGEPDRVGALIAQSATWASRAIRARPRLWIQYRGFRPPFVHLVFIGRSAILHATAGVLHGMSGHRIRAAWHLKRANRVRRGLVKTALRAFARSDWQTAAAAFDLARVGAYDSLERTASVHSAIALKQLGNFAGAEAVWLTALQRDPDALRLRSSLAMASQSGAGVRLPNGVPGAEPTEPGQVEAQVEALRAQFTPVARPPFERV